MPSIKIPTNFNIDLEFEIPEFFRRVLAVLIDYFIVFVYIKVMWAVITSFAAAGYRNDETWLNMHWAAIALISGPVFFYHLLMEVTMNGQTPGKKLLRLRVVNENGGKAGISQLFIRWMLREIWFLLILAMGINKEETGEKAGAVFMIIAVMIYFIADIVLVATSKKGQRIGDLLARTILIRTVTRSNIEETVFMEVADSYVPSYPQIMQLSDRDINSIKNILETARKRGDYHMAEAAADRIKNHLKIDTRLPAFDFLDVLLKDYNYLSTN